jgi:uncharacterized membrane protein
MKRDTKIVLAVVGAIPAAILSASMLCAWAIANGASTRWRLLFRTLCHGLPERSLEVFGTTMPICARCFGIYVGLAAGLAAFGLVRYLSERAMRMTLFVAVTPLAIDGLTQLAGLRESTNPLRIATGLAAGLCFGLWVLCAVEHRDDALATFP